MSNNYSNRVIFVTVLVGDLHNNCHLKESLIKIAHPVLCVMDPTLSNLQFKQYLVIAWPVCPLILTLFLFRQASSEEFIPIFANNPRELREFLEHMIMVEASSPQGVYDTLLELRLQDWAHEQDPEVNTIYYS